MVNSKMMIMSTNINMHMLAHFYSSWLMLAKVNYVGSGWLRLLLAQVG
jgi:hypothetical protein